MNGVANIVWPDRRTRVASRANGLLAVWLAAALRVQSAPGPEPTASPGAEAVAAPPPAAASATNAVGPAAVPEQVQINADRLSYDRDKGVAEGSGHVVIRRGPQELRADYARVNMDSEDAYAVGSATFTDGKETFAGQELRYNFRTNLGEARSASGDASPYRFTAGRMERTGPNTYVLNDARVTSCEYMPPDSHYYIRARRVVLVPGQHMKGRNAVWYFGKVPCMYLPFWYKTLRPGFGFEVKPGYDSLWGQFLLVAYRYRFSPELDGKTHLDYRSRRGVAVGQDFAWHAEDGTSPGEVTAYYLNDKDPGASVSDPEKAGIAANRYRIHARQTERLTPRDSATIQANYQSDANVIEEFFDGEYRNSRQPDNYGVYVHRGDSYTASVLARKRLNSFFTTVERLPELSLDINRQELAESGFYYEGQDTLSSLDKVFDDRGGGNSYSIYRVDSDHMLYRPFRSFGFLNLVPRVGYRATYFSETIEEKRNQGGGLRSVLELGQEVSFKAFKTWSDIDPPMRHVVEPYANYTFVPTPNLRPTELHQFDSVDKIDEENDVRFGVRNKLQVKRRGQPYDLVDVDVATTYRFWRLPTQRGIEDIDLSADIRPIDAIRLRSTGSYNLPDHEVTQFDTRLWILPAKFWGASLSHRYIYNSTSLVAADVSLYPTDGWTYNVYGRQELENGRFEEGGGYVQRNLDCMSIRFGFGVLPGYEAADGTQVKDDYRAIVEMWIKAFPGNQLGGRYDY